MRIDRYVYDERLTWGAAGVLLVVSALHAAGIGRLFVHEPAPPSLEAAPPIFEVRLEKLPPPRLPDLQPDRPPEPDALPPPDEPIKRPQQTRPVPILVDTPTTDPVPPDTWVKPYELGDEALPGVIGPKVEGGVPDGEGFEDAPQGPRHVYEKLKPVFVLPPTYPARCLRLGIEGRVQLKVLVGENGRVQEATIGKSSGDASLDEAALEAVRKWRFEAARRDGAPVRAWALVPIEFKLID